MPFEIIGKLPLFRRNALGILEKVDGYVVGARMIANSVEEAKNIAANLFSSGRGFESIVIQDPQNPQNGAIEFWIEGQNQSLKDYFKNDGKCPFCSSTEIKRKIIEGPLSEKEAASVGYWYKSDCRCKLCNKEWYGLDYYRY